jgi:hypothetical protein
MAKYCTVSWYKMNHVIVSVLTIVDRTCYVYIGRFVVGKKQATGRQNSMELYLNSGALEQI